MTRCIVLTMWERIFQQKHLTCRRATWEKLLCELKRRGRGTSESGAFLLGTTSGRTRRIEDFLPYDEVDPDCLRGYIVFDGSKMDHVWRECRRRGLSVVADVHTHPMGCRQSSLDQENPMLPEPGHIALIIPNFANRIYVPEEIGIYEFLGNMQWRDRSTQGSRYFSIEG